MNNEVFKWAKIEVKKKKPQYNFERARLGQFTEGLCVQALHIGPYATESETLSRMQAYMNQMNLKDDIYGDTRHHHEIYLSDPRKTAPEKLKTIIRHPVAR